MTSGGLSKTEAWNLQLQGQLDFVWKWIDRMAREEISVEEALDVLTHYPTAPKWVLRRPAATEQGDEKP